MAYTFTSSAKNVRNNETLNNFPDMRDNLDSIFEISKTILMVGWRYNSDHVFVDHIIKEGKELTIVEIHGPNLLNVPKEVTAVHADIRHFEPTEHFDLFLWQHGPEHVKREDVFKVIDRLKGNFDYMVIETPNGYSPQDEMYDNEYEKHLSTWEGKDYDELGFYWGTYAGPNNDAFLIGYRECI